MLLSRSTTTLIGGAFELTRYGLNSANLTGTALETARTCYSDCMSSVALGQPVLGQCDSEDTQLQAAACICKIESAVSALEACHTTCLPSGTIVPDSAHISATCVQATANATAEEAAAKDSAVDVRLSVMAVLASLGATSAALIFT